MIIAPLFYGACDRYGGRFLFWELLSRLFLTNANLTALEAGLPDRLGRAEGDGPVLQSEPRQKTNKE
jgi:hypothetical protein